MAVKLLVDSSRLTPAGDERKAVRAALAGFDPGQFRGSGLVDINVGWPLRLSAFSSAAARPIYLRQIRSQSSRND
jgi:hypothetical protein